MGNERKEKGLRVRTERAIDGRAGCLRGGDLSNNAEAPRRGKRGEEKKSSEERSNLEEFRRICYKGGKGEILKVGVGRNVDRREKRKAVWNTW